MVENSNGACVIFCFKELELDRFFDMLQFDNDSSSQETFCGHWTGMKPMGIDMVDTTPAHLLSSNDSYKMKA